MCEVELGWGEWKEGWWVYLMGGSSGMLKGVFWIWFFISLLLGYSDGIMLRRMNGCELGASDGYFLGNVEWTLDW